MSLKKIVSLLPAATEIVCALGLAENLVGISHECDYPPGIGGLPVCTSSKVDSALPSAEIDRTVKSILTNALSVYELNASLIRSLQPDVIITQSQCKVCAVSLDEVENDLRDLLQKDVEVISLEPATLTDVFADIRRVGKVLNAGRQAGELVEILEERSDIITHKLKFVNEKPRVACIEWLSPLMLAGNWTPGLVERAGGTTFLVEDGRHSPFVEFSEIFARDPEIIVVIPCGFSIERTLTEIHLLLNQPGFSELSAVKNNRIYIADGNQYFNRSGPRLVDSLEILAEIIQPKQFVFGYQGSGWIQFKV